MSNRYPELLYVAGPQGGTRVELNRAVAVAGRGPAADVRIDEQYVSRKHVQFTFTTEGWVVENLSDNPVFINDKKYKKGVRIILETGDVLGVGDQTHLLFVAQGDDPQAALDHWRATRAPKPPEPVPEPEPKTPEDLEQDVTLESAPASQVAPRSKFAKYLPWIIIWAVLMAALAAFGMYAKLHGSKDKTMSLGTSAPTRLSFEEISSILSADLERGIDKDPDPLLTQAKAYYQERNNRDNALFLSVKYFKLYKANSETHLLPTTDDERLYDRALNDLIARVAEKYNTACVLSGAKRWLQAQRLFEELEAMLPYWSEPLPRPENPLYQNIRDHWKYVRRQSQRDLKRR